MQKIAMMKTINSGIPTFIQIIDFHEEAFFIAYNYPYWYDRLVAAATLRF
jgi:hypothetical protein